MTAPRRYGRQLVWYPAEWRDRYGDELTVLMEDRYAGGPVPWRDRTDLVLAGIRAHLRPRRWTSVDDRRRAGALLVLWGWTATVVAVAVVAKAADRWVPATPVGQRAVPGAAFTVLTVAGASGSTLVATAAVLTVPALLRRLRHGGWPTVRGPVVRTAVLTAASVGTTGALAAWARHLDAAARNGGSVPYEVAVVVWAVLVVATLVSAAAAAARVVPGLDLGHRTTAALALLGAAVAVAVVAVLAATGVWWGSEALHAPGFLGSTIGSGLPVRSTTAPPALVAAGALLLVGAALAGAGTVRLARRRPVTG